MMAFLGNRARYVACLAASFLTGCQLVPSGQYNTMAQQNRALTEQTHAQTAEIENLKSHGHQIEDKLILAEEQLALADQKRGTDEKKLANYQTERNKLRDQFASYSHGPVKIPPEVSSQLADLSRWIEDGSFVRLQNITADSIDVRFGGLALLFFEIVR